MSSEAGAAIILTCTRDGAKNSLKPAPKRGGKGGVERGGKGGVERDGGGGGGAWQPLGRARGSAYLEVLQV